MPRRGARRGKKPPPMAVMSSDSSSEEPDDDVQGGESRSDEMSSYDDHGRARCVHVTCGRGGGGEVGRA